MRILLDMDEVLADFIGGACQVWGVDKAEVYRYWKVGEWTMVPALAKALHLDKLTHDEFLEPIKNNAKFWAKLAPHPWMPDLVETVRRLTTDWHIISAPILCPESYKGKVDWLKHHFGLEFDQFAITPHKAIFAGPDVLLIDDRDENIEAFRRAGGRGIVWPAPNNSQYTQARDPLAYVRHQLMEEVHYAPVRQERQPRISETGGNDPSWDAAH